jgi:hypothetical protein
MASNLALFMEMLEDMCLNGVNPVTTVSIGYTPSSGSNGGSTGGNSGSDDELSDEEFHELFAFTTQLLFEQIYSMLGGSLSSRIEYNDLTTLIFAAINGVDVTDDHIVGAAGNGVPYGIQDGFFPLRRACERDLGASSALVTGQS